MEEEPADYCVSGGYLRVAVGDKLGPNGRYTVKRKLGYVWFSFVRCARAGRGRSALLAYLVILLCWPHLPASLDQFTWNPCLRSSLFAIQMGWFLHRMAGP